MEPFAYFQKLGRGVPVLEAWEDSKDPQVVHVTWHDGRMWEREEFAATLALDEMSAALHAVWLQHRHRRNGRTRFSCEDVSGHITYAPTDVGMAMFEIVHAYFTRALYSMYAIKLKQRKLRKIEKRLRGK